MDEGGLLLYPELTARGLIAQRDFETFYGPLNIWLLAGSYKLFGVSVATERVVGALYHLSVALAAAWFASRISLWASLLAGLAVLVILLRLDLVAFAWFPASAALLGMLAALNPDAFGGNRRAAGAVAGLLGGLATSFRPELCALILIAIVPSVLRWRRQEGYSFLAGAVIGVIPLLAHLLIAGPLTVLQAFATVVFVAAPLRRLLLPGPASSAAAFYAASLLALSVLTMVVCSLILIRRRRAWDSKTLWHVTGLLVALGLTYQAMQRLDVAHSAFVASITIPIALTFGLEVLREAPPQTRKRWLGLPAMAFAAALLIFAATHVAFLAQNGLMTHGAHWVTASGRTFPVASQEEAAHVQAILNYLSQNTHAGERLIIGSDDFYTMAYADTYLYFLLPALRPGTRYLEWNPGSVNGPGSSLPQELQQADVVIENTHDFAEPDVTQFVGPRTAQNVLRARFCEVAGSGSYHVLKPCLSN